MRWKHPSITKIYEALGAVADGRVEVLGNVGKVWSSSRNKFYNVEYSPELQAIMSNDNSSYWKGELGYPAIAFLMQIRVLPHDKDAAESLKGVAWKDINQKFKNDFDKALEYILSSKTEEERAALADLTKKIDGEIKALNLSLLGKKSLPPEGY